MRYFNPALLRKTASAVRSFLFFNPALLHKTASAFHYFNPGLLKTAEFTEDLKPNQLRDQDPDFYNWMMHNEPRAIDSRSGWFFDDKIPAKELNAYRDFYNKSQVDEQNKKLNKYRASKGQTETDYARGESPGTHDSISMKAYRAGLKAEDMTNGTHEYDEFAKNNPEHVEQDEFHEDPNHLRYGYNGNYSKEQFDEYNKNVHSKGTFEAYKRGEEYRRRLAENKFKTPQEREFVQRQLLTLGAKQNDDGSWGEVERPDVITDKEYDDYVQRMNDPEEQDKEWLRQRMDEYEYFNKVDPKTYNTPEALQQRQQQRWIQNLNSHADQVQYMNEKDMQRALNDPNASEEVKTAIQNTRTQRAQKEEDDLFASQYYGGTVSDYESAKEALADPEFVKQYPEAAESNRRFVEAYERRKANGTLPQMNVEGIGKTNDLKQLQQIINDPNADPKLKEAATNRMQSRNEELAGQWAERSTQEEYEQEKYYLSQATSEGGDKFFSPEMTDRIRRNVAAYEARQKQAQQQSPMSQQSIDQYNKIINDQTGAYTERQKEVARQNLRQYGVQPAEPQQQAQAQQQNQQQPQQTNAAQPAATQQSQQQPQQQTNAAQPAATQQQPQATNYNYRTNDIKAFYTTSGNFYNWVNNNIGGDTKTWSEDQWQNAANQYAASDMNDLERESFQGLVRPYQPQTQTQPQQRAQQRPQQSQQPTVQPQPQPQPQRVAQRQPVRPAARPAARPVARQQYTPPSSMTGGSGVKPVATVTLPKRSSIGERLGLR